MRFPRAAFRDSKDYEAAFERVLSMERPTKILKFSTTPHGIDVILDVEKEKVAALKEAFRGEEVTVHAGGHVSLDKNACIDCGHCVSLCNVAALYFGEDHEVLLDSERCVGCGLCVDCCPRGAILEER